METSPLLLGKETVASKNRDNFQVSSKTKRPTISKSLSPKTELPFISDSFYQFRKEVSLAQGLLCYPQCGVAELKGQPHSLACSKKAAFWNTLPMADALCTVANWLPLSVLTQLKGQPGSVQAGDRNHAGYLNREEIIYRILTRKLKWPKGDMERLSPRQQLRTGAVT